MAPVSGDLTAFVDESSSHSTYILAATVIDPTAAAHATDEMRSLHKGKTGKLHWNSEGTDRRRFIADRLAHLGLAHLVVVRTTSRTERSERQRRKCLERLAMEAEQLSIPLMILESRGKADDRRDLETLQTLRAQKRLGPRLRIAHERGPAQPLLWIPDVVCGAYHGQGPEWLTLADSCTVHEVLA